MFELRINGNPEPFEVVEETTFGQVMEKLSHLMNDSGRVITEILMNDQSLVGGKQVDYYNYPLDKVDSIELITADPCELASQTLDSLEEYREELIRNCSRAAELFRLGDDIEANELYSRVIEGWRWLIKGINAMLGMLNVDIIGLEAQGRNLAQYQGEVLIPLFDRMLEAQKREDWIALADLLEFELIETLNVWDEFLLEMRRYAKKA